MENSLERTGKNGRTKRGTPPKATMAPEHSIKGSSVGRITLAHKIRPFLAPETARPGCHKDVYKRQVLEISKEEMNQETILAHASGGVSEHE